METYNVCCRLPSKLSRFQITITDTDGQISNLHQEIGKHVDVKECDFDILYAGQVLRPEKKISTFDIQNHSTLYIVPRFTDSSSHPNEGPKVSNKEILMAIQSALLNQEYKSIVERMLTDAETVENIIATTPGLDKDPSVLSMMAKPELLTILAHPNNLDSLLKKHPSFAQAAITIATAVNEEGAKSGATPNIGAASYSLDQMSDEDDDLPGPSRSQASAAGQSITASQLAAALHAATGSSRQFDQTGGTPNDPGPSGSGTAITSDFFQQAMLQAQSASSSDGASQQLRDMGNALQQLRDMGITDENVARQALAATNGDIQAAIDLIFGDGFM